MRRRKDARVRSSAGHVGSHGVRKSRLASRNAAHSAQSDICGLRSTTPSPATAGICAATPTVRKNAMMISNQTVSRRMSDSGTPLLDFFVHHQTSRCPASETVGDRGGTFKSRTGTERGDGGPTTRNQSAPSGARALDRDGFNFFDQFLERNGTHPIQKLARELLGAGR